MPYKAEKNVAYGKIINKVASRPSFISFINSMFKHSNDDLFKIVPYIFGHPAHKY